jgi:hypothetical protein
MSTGTQSERVHSRWPLQAAALHSLPPARLGLSVARRFIHSSVALLVFLTSCSVAVDWRNRGAAALLLEPRAGGFWREPAIPAAESGAGRLWRAKPVERRAGTGPPVRGWMRVGGRGAAGRGRA